jgi:phosphoribosylamine--glycine ligase
MKVLVIGGGGREHAMVWKLAQSPRITGLWCAPGNAGIATEFLASNGTPVECVAIGAEDITALLAFAKEQQIELTVVGPDNPLALGVVDRFREAGLRIWGPTQKAAQFESSKVFSQEFMERHGIPTRKSGSFADPGEAVKFARKFNGRVAVKADGLALGKGVLICENDAQASAAIDEILVKKAFGESGNRVLIQELIEGPEISLHFLCDGKTAKLFPSSQDHKRALDGDRGLNTGGMGTYSPAPLLSDKDFQSVANRIIEPWLAGCAKEGIDYRGILYPGVMMTKDGPKLLEFNSRFGDPETQVYLPRLKNDLVDLIDACIDQTLDQVTLGWSDDACVCVVMASGGYPGRYMKGTPILGIAEAERRPNTKVFHAGTKLIDRTFATNGGRVLGVTSWAPTLHAARNAAYSAVEQIRFEGAQYRTDIAAKSLNN